MIFVTVGTADRGIEFTRLVREMDRIAAALDEDVLIQRGTMAYEPAHARHVRFLGFGEAMDRFREASLVVGHCGAGTVLNALRFGTPLVVVPRRRDAGELDSDDHQLQLAAALAETDGVTVVHDIADLEGVVRDRVAHPPPAPRPSRERQRFIEAVRGFVADAARHTGGRHARGVG